MLYQPDWIVGDIVELPVATLLASGIRAVVFDLDNTLVIPKSADLAPHRAAWLNTLRDNGLALICLTNNRNPAYCAQCQAVLGMPFVTHAKKPWPKGFRQVLAQLNLPPAQILMVGDRPLTDIQGGVLHGMKTALCRPINAANEPWFVHGLRWLEHRVIRTPAKNPLPLATPNTPELVHVVGA